MKYARVLKWAVGIALVGGVVLVVALRLLLASSFTTSRVAAQLTDLTGAPARLGSADVGFKNTSLSRLQLFEAGANPAADTPWATADEVTANLSAWDLLKGSTSPSRLELKNAVILLRFDKDSHLLTRLPTPAGERAGYPTVTFTNSKVTIRQEGRPDLVVGNINGTLTPHGKRLDLEGAVKADPTWGDWEASGWLEPATGACTGTLRTDRIHLTQAQLEGLPFVPPVVWTHFQAKEGDTPVELTLRYDAVARATHYRVGLEPENTTVRVPSIDLDAVDAAGQVIIEDAVVHLLNVRGEMFDPRDNVRAGDVYTNGTLDFTNPTVSRLEFHLTVQRVDIHHLPPKWPQPPKIVEAGKLSGHADLVLTIDNHKLNTSGQGEGEITEARIFKKELTKPITIRMKTTGSGFEFYWGNPSAFLDGNPQALAALVGVAMLGELPAPEPERALNPLTLPAKVVGLVTEGVNRLGEGIDRAGKMALSYLPRVEPPDDRSGGSVDVNLSLEDVDLEQVVKGLDLNLPVPVRGRASFTVAVAVPLKTADDVKTYRLKGTADLSRLEVAGVVAEDVHARINYSGGVLRLEGLEGRMPADEKVERGPDRAGTFNGSGEVQVAPAGDVTANLTLDRIPLGQVVRLVPAAGKVRGAVSGSVEGRAPLAKLQDPAAWTASGKLSGSRIDVQGLALEDAEAELRLADGRLTTKSFRGKAAGTDLTGSASARLTEPYAYEASLGVEKADLAALQKLAAEVRPPFPVAGKFTAQANLEGTLCPLRVNASGTASGSDLTLDNVKVASADFRWDLDNDRLKVIDVKADLYQGKATGSATLPVAAKQEGAVDLRFEDVDVGALARAVPAVPVRLEGKASGTVEGTLTAAKKDGDREFDGKVTLRSQRLRVQSFTTERLTGTVGYRDGVAEYKLEGDALGGKFTLTGKVPLTEEKKPAAPPPGALLPVRQAAPPEGEGRFTLQGAQLTRLWRDLGVERALGPLHGRLDLDLPYRLGPDGRPVGVGTATVTRLRWNEEELAATLGGTVRLRSDEVRVTDLTGVIGEGLLRGSVAVSLRPNGRGWFNLALERVEVSRVLAPFTGACGSVSGPAEVRLRGTLGRDVTASGYVLLDRGKVYGVEVNDWRLPVDLEYSPAGGRGRLSVRDSAAQVARGRVTGSATLDFGTTNRLDGNLRFQGVDLQTLLRQAADTSQVGAGKMNGRFDFSSSDLRSPNDLGGTLQATFQQTQALEFPVLRQVAPFVGPGQAGSTFSSGELRGRLGNGVFRVERLSLAGRTVRLYAAGTVSLAGRLDLELTASTEQLGPNPRLLRLLGLRIPAVGPIPVGAIIDATSYLSNRAVHLRVTGTVRSPTIQVEPLATLTEEAVRFFFSETGLPLAPTGP
jgi:hypothetical protein